MMKPNPRCRIGKVTPKEAKGNLNAVQPSNYRSEKELVDWARNLFNVLRDEHCVAAGVILETVDGTITNHIVTPKGRYMTLIAQTDILKHTLIDQMWYG